MPLKQNFTFLILLFISFLSLGMQGQSLQAPGVAYSWFDEQIGLENTDLLKGIEYIEQENTINDKHKFFVSPYFQSGALVYAGEPYFNIKMKYNVYDDLLLVQLRNKEGDVVFEPIKEKISSFEFHGHHFKNVMQKGQNHEVQNGFYEVLFRSKDLMLLKKYLKKGRKKLDREVYYYEFKDRAPQYAIYVDGKYLQLTRKNILHNFPSSEKLIKDFYRSQGALKRADTDLFMVNLFEQLSAKNQGENSAGK